MINFESAGFADSTRLDSTRLDSKRRSRIAVAILSGVGIFLVIGSVLARTVSFWQPKPGQLIAKKSEMTWLALDEKAGASGAIEADATFEIVNPGGIPVRITGVESSCGCTTARVSPEIITPGGKGVVDVRGTPYAVGERLVTVSLRTDSPLTPVVHLLFRMLSSRKPPFLLQAGADLAYVGESFKDDLRQVVAITVESAGSKKLPPVVKTNLPFLEISPPTVQEVSFADPLFVQRKYFYDVRLNSSTPESSFAGEVTVVDPWDDRHSPKIIVRGEPVPIIRVAPARIILDANRDASADFVVLAKEASSNLVVETRGPESPLIIRPESGQGERMARYSVRLKPGPIREGVYEVAVRPARPSVDPVVVSVLVRGGEGR